MSKNHSKTKKVRSSLTGKDLSNKESIATDEALDWVKKQGFLVIESKKILERSEKDTNYLIQRLFLVFLLAVSFVALMPLVSSAYWSTGLDSDLQNYYKFDGDTLDSLANNNGTSTSTNIGGIINQAQYFDGSQVMNNNGTKTFEDIFSLSFWLNTNRTSGSGDGEVIWTKSIDGSNLEWVSLTSTEVNLWIGCGSGCQDHYVTSGANLQVNTWYNIVILRSGTGSYNNEIWINGVNQSVTTARENNGNPSGTPNNYLIGADNLILGTYFQGRLDEFGVWKRVLTSSEIALLYNSGIGLQYGNYAPGIPSSVTINLQAPANNSILANTNVTYSAFVYSSRNITNVSLLVDGSILQTNTSGYNYTSYYFNAVNSETIHTWLINACDDNVTCYNSQIRAYLVDSSYIAPKTNGIFYVDFSLHITLLIFILLFLLAGALAFTSQELASGVIFLVMGFVMIYNNVNAVLSGIFIIAGALIGLAGESK